jgi:hypothetical protein
MKRKTLFYFLLVFFFAARLVGQNFTNLDYELFEEAKIKLEKNDPSIIAAYEKLIERANTAIEEGSFSVMSKTQVPPSGDKHDYLSLAPYFWSDSSKANGLPWIRKDGQINPETRGVNVDYDEKNHFFRNVRILAWAHFFSGEIKYARKAEELLEVWFLNPDTKMNPNLNYAQGIPGINQGRCFGIIEFGGISGVISAIELLEMKKALKTKTSIELRNWLSEYLDWLQTSEFGLLEKTRSNNHGTYYDGQVVNLLLFLDRDKEAKEVLESVKTSRIATQIEPDGSQPLELARTNGLSYSTMNLRGLTELANFGRKNGVDLWNYKAKNGASIQKGYSFLAPYALGEKKWEYQQIGDPNSAIENLKKLFRNAVITFGTNDLIDPAIYSDLDNQLVELF